MPVDLLKKLSDPVHSTKLYNTPNLDELESGPWPSFVTGMKRLASDTHEGAKMVRDVLATLETSYVTKKGYWKGGTVGVIGYGGGVIPRFNELKDTNGAKFKDASEFHTLRIQPPAGMHYTSDLLRNLCDTFTDNGGSGLIAFHGQSGDIMFQGATEDTTQTIFNELNDIGFDMGGAGPAVRTGMSCVGAARCEMSNTNEQAALRTLVNAFLDDMHRPALPYKMKFKVSGVSSFINGTTTVPNRSPILSVLLPPIQIVTPLSSPVANIASVGISFVIYLCVKGDVTFKQCIHLTQFLLSIVSDVSASTFIA